MAAQEQGGASLGLGDRAYGLGDLVAVPGGPVSELGGRTAVPGGPAAVPGGRAGARGPAWPAHPLEPAAARLARTGTGRRAGGHHPQPAWLRQADACQRSLRHPLPVVADLAVGAVAVSGLTGSFAAAALAAAAHLVTGLLFGVWKRRSPVQAQGIGWYVVRLLPVTTVMALGLHAYPGGGWPAAVEGGVIVLLWLTWAKLILWIVVSAARRRGKGLTPALVIGPERRVAGAEYRIHLYPEAGLVCARSHVCSPRQGGDPAEALALIESLLADQGVGHVVCAGDDTGSDSFIRDVVRLAPPELDVTVVQQVPPAGVPMTRLGDLGVICLARPSWGSESFKRAFDILASGLLIGVLWPVLVATAAAVRLSDPGPAIFRQVRTGRANRLFTIYKFRSMIDGADQLKPDLLHRNVADGLLFKAEDDPRITPVGRVIRRFAIDELPQLVNVLKGQMSLVGPRPLPVMFAESDLFARTRHRVLPGITGPWQVKGANALPYEDMIDLDCAYVATRSFGFDLKILMQTLPAVLVRRDPY